MTLLTRALFAGLVSALYLHQTATAQSHGCCDKLRLTFPAHGEVRGEGLYNLGSTPQTANVQAYNDRPVYSHENASLNFNLYFLIKTLGNPVDWPDEWWILTPHAQTIGDYDNFGYTNYEGDTVCPNEVGPNWRDPQSTPTANSVDPTIVWECVSTSPIPIVCFSSSSQ